MPLSYPIIYLYDVSPGKDMVITFEYMKAQLFEQAMAITNLLLKFVECTKLWDDYTLNPY